MKKLLLFTAVVAIGATAFTLTAADKEKSEKRESERPRSERDLPRQEQENREGEEQRKRALLEQLRKRRAVAESEAHRDRAENQELAARNRAAMARETQERLNRSREQAAREREEHRREPHGPEPRRVSREEAERHMHHLREAAELLGAIGRVDLSRQLGREADEIGEKIERSVRERGERHEGPGNHELAGALERLQDHVTHLTRKVEELERRLNAKGKERP